MWDTVKVFLNKSFFTKRKNRMERYGMPFAFALMTLLTKSFLQTLF